MDCVRADRLSVYGYDKSTTPYLASLARDATVYDNCIATTCWTLPSHASLFTGLYPSEHGVVDQGTRLPSSYSTLAEKLAQVGYSTCCVTNNGWISKSTDLARGFARLEEVWRRHVKVPAAIRAAMHMMGIWDTGAKATNDLIYDAIDEGPAPFFIFVNYMEAHHHCRPPWRFRRRFVPTTAFTAWTMMAEYRYASRRQDIVVEWPEEQLNVLRALYEGAICYLDSKIAELIDFLDRRGILDNTVVVITADHGENIGDHGLAEHQLCLYESLIRVPLLIRFPEVFQRGRRVETLVQLNDVFATLCHLGGADAEGAQTQRTGAVKLPQIAADVQRTYAYSEYIAPQTLISAWRKRHRSFDIDSKNRDLYAVRGERYKYIMASNDQDEMYDLHSDADEKLNVIEKYPDEAAELQETLSTFRRGLQRGQSATGEIGDAETIRRLTELGYL